MAKLALYFIFLVTFYLDMENYHECNEITGERIKDNHYYARKVICLVIQIMFMFYEFLQYSKVKKEYFEDNWNLLEVGGIIIFCTASILDISSSEVNDACKILYVLSMIFALMKVLYLIRISKSMSFLVTMMIQVVADLNFFMLLFIILILTFAECYHILQVDILSYGRMPAIVAHWIATLRSAYGDFALINPYQGFDIYDLDLETGEKIYRESQLIAIFTFFIW